MARHQIAVLFANGDLCERYALHVEEDPVGEWKVVKDNLDPGCTAIHYVDGVEVERFYNDGGDFKDLIE